MIGPPIVLTLARDVKAWTKLVNNLERAAAQYPAVTERAMVYVARWIKRQIQVGIRRGAPGGEALLPNAPATIRRKGHARVLRDTDTLLNSIAFDVTRRGPRVTAAIGVARFVAYASRPSRTAARVGAMHEFGFHHMGRGVFHTSLNYLRRQFLEPVAHREAPEILKLFTRIWEGGMSRYIRFHAPLRPTAAGSVRGIGGTFLF